jgi:hypothetical protein
MASRALDGDQSSKADLLSEMGDGAELDGLLARLMGDAGEASIVAQQFARSRDHRALATLYFQMDDVRKFSASRTRSRRGLKFFTVLSLGFVFVRLARQVPAAKTNVTADGNEMVGPFADFVEAVDFAYAIEGGENGLDAAILAAVDVGRSQYETALMWTDLPDCDWTPPRFGTPAFIAFEAK